MPAKVAAMRMTRVLGAVLAAVVLTTAGCARVVEGTPQANTDPPGSEITEDGSGILIGYHAAPVRIEIFAEPQCPPCGRLQRDYGDEIAEYVGEGRLAVVYRPMTFLDLDGPGYSAHVSNALFLAAGPDTDATTFQKFVQTVWSNQEPEGSAGPSDDELADMASESGISADLVDRIRSGDEGVDIDMVAEQNIEYLTDAAGVAATPAVYDLNEDTLVPLRDDWLSDLMLGLGS
ncbi:thioredoxin domain-containing protein [Mycolicibacterium smegmatis]|nr:thioredoxin domain-containing protein [Mycolicibacterium smegmatis]ULN29972.1 thioredoxin domain-containing protein [Mycolicibacterium smegmatis]